MLISIFLKIPVFDMLTIKIIAKACKIDLFKEPRQFMDFHEVTGKINKRLNSR